jgi:UDP-3-O-[3-hydroxymyristoyl] glucosamine N-acyltransferase
MNNVCVIEVPYMLFFNLASYNYQVSKDIGPIHQSKIVHTSKEIKENFVINPSVLLFVHCMKVNAFKGKIKPHKLGQ